MAMTVPVPVSEKDAQNEIESRKFSFHFISLHTNACI